MLLTLSIKNHQGKAPLSSEEYNFGNSGGSIGLDNSNDWTLSDNNRYLSRKHAVIEFIEGSFYITDNSANGTFINHSGIPLGRGNQHKINPSDEITMGEYTIIVSQLDESDPLAESNLLKDNPKEDPFFTLKPYKYDDDDPFGELDDNKKKTDSIEEKIQSPIPPSVTKNLNATTHDDNPLGKLDDNKKKTDSIEKIQSPIPPSVTKNLNATTKEKNIQEQVTLKETESSSTGISTDYPTRIKRKETKDIKKKTHKDQTISKEANIPPSTKKETKDTKKKTHQAEITSKETKHPISNTLTPEKTHSEKITEKIANIDALSHILLSAGLTTEDINKIPANVEIYQLIGLVLKESLDGTINLLRSRNAAKNHLHLENTIISRCKNNPLKFLPRTDLVLKQTLLPNQTGDTYLTLPEALQEAYDDISAHEYSMATSIQEALAITIKKHFEPKSLQKKLEKDNPISSKIPLKREADLWQLFNSIYEEIAEEASESFQILLDKEIVKAYEIQIEHLKKKRNR